MKRRPDPLLSNPPWHIDCRLEAELPEDTIVGTRFLINAVATACAVGALLYAGYLGFITRSLGVQIADWELRMRENRAEVRAIEVAQRDFLAESVKIDQAHALVAPELYVSSFIASLGRTRPEQMSIDILDWNDGGIILRGSLKESSKVASELLGGYVEILRRDPRIGPLFREIVLTDIDRAAGDQLLKFEIVFRLTASRS